MEMKKIAFAVLFVAAFVSAVMASEATVNDAKAAAAGAVPAAADAAAAVTENGAPAPGPASGAFVNLPALGSVVGASLVSLIAYYIH